jgi:serine/threonine protein kinase
MKHSGFFGLVKKPMDIKNLLLDQHSRSREQTFVGTPCYMPPEMKENRTYDEKGDLWSLGCIIFELLIGETYYTEEDDQ